MLELIKQTWLHQYEAALATLKLCCDHCPDEYWNQPVHRAQFCQAVFHTLFFADLYLGEDVESQRLQPFHLDNTAVFSGYEELEDRLPENTYSRAFLDLYFEHVHNKIKSTIEQEAPDRLAKRSGFPWLDVPRAEVHPYNIRHIQHHAAQLILRMRIDGIHESGWVKSGWPTELA